MGEQELHLAMFELLEQTAPAWAKIKIIGMNYEVWYKHDGVGMAWVCGRDGEVGYVVWRRDGPQCRGKLDLNNPNFAEDFWRFLTKEAVQKRGR